MAEEARKLAAKAERLARLKESGKLAEAKIEETRTAEGQDRQISSSPRQLLPACRFCSARATA